MTEQDRFFFYSQSRDVLPGHGANERGDPNHYKSLSSIRDWRKMLSNFWIEPFEAEGAHYASVEHYYHSKKFPLFPEWQKQFTMESESEISKNPAMAKGAGRKTGKYQKRQIRPIRITADPRVFKKENNDRIFIVGMFSKFTQSKRLKEALLATGNVQLWHIVSRGKPIRFTYLEKVRECIRKFDSQTDLAIISKAIKLYM